MGREDPWPQFMPQNFVHLKDAFLMNNTEIFLLVYHGVFAIFSLRVITFFICETDCRNLCSCHILWASFYLGLVHGRVLHSASN